MRWGGESWRGRIGYSFFWGGGVGVLGFGGKEGGGKGGRGK